MIRRRPGIALTLALVLAFAACSFSWTNTPYGKLDYRAAFSLHALSFEIPFKPDPGLDFEFRLPVNLIYSLSAMLPAAAVARTEDIVIPGGEGRIPARVYWPEEPASARPPLLVYLHGGGFVVGSVDIFDPLTRQLAARSGAIVISVDYRLAPRDPWPAAPDDAYAALVWAASNAGRLGADPSRLMVGGDSAGGNLATVVALMARDRGTPALAAQILYYPVVDLGDNGTEWPSAVKFQDGYGGSTAARDAYNRAYFGHLRDTRVPYLSPYRASSLAGLPRALIVTAGFDPLTDSVRAYADRLQADGVAVERAHFPTMIHGFMSVRLFSQQRRAVDRTVDFVHSVVEGRYQSGELQARSRGVAGTGSGSALPQLGTRPPFTPMVWPVTYPLSSAASQQTALAMSSAMPVRPTGIVAFNWSSVMRKLLTAASDMIVPMMAPGGMLLTVMPYLPSATASERVMAMIAPLEAL